MSGTGIVQFVLYLVVLILLVKPLGCYIVSVYEGQSRVFGWVFGPVERLTYRLCSINTLQEMNWQTYLASMLYLNLLGLLALYLIQRLQLYLPLNPQVFSPPSAFLAFNTATSFVTNTNWQAYSGETSMSYGTQMLGLTVQNFLSAATGMSLLLALIRGLASHGSTNLGNFWVDTVRGILYIFLPLSCLLAIILTSQGVIQNFKPYQKITLLQPTRYDTIVTDPSGNPLLDKDGMQQKMSHVVAEQIIPMGPAASQIAIKQLGTNGGGFFNTNSAHPFENPTPLTNFLETLALLLIPAALCYSFGLMVKDKRQGLAILIAMLLVFIPSTLISMYAEQKGNPALTHLGVDQIPKAYRYSAGNMEGKELRFGPINSAIYAVAATASSNGSQNAMLDSFTPLGSIIPLWMMHLGEVIFGGVGSGLYGMLMIIIITVFAAGLMVGRTPEYLGKKIEPYEMKMASFAVLVMPLIVLISSAIAVVIPAGLAAIGNPGAQGFSEILYAFTSMGNNNGSAFAGLNANSTFYNLLGGGVMLISRYWIAIPTLAIAGSLAKKKIIPTSSGTLVTHSFIFIILLVCVMTIIGALSFFPALALGPIVEQLILWEQYGR